jgi:hypothetical protein
MARLLAICTKLFPSQAKGKSTEIQCLLNDNGYVIESITDVQPGSTVYASRIDPDFEYHDPESDSGKRSLVISDAIKRTKPKPKQLTYTPIAAPSRVPIVAAKKAPAIDLPKTLTDALELDAQEDSKAPLLFRASQVKPKTAVDLRQLARKQLSSDSEEEKPPPKSTAAKLTKFLQKAQAGSDDGDDEEVKRRQERKQKQEQMQSCVVLKHDENLAMQQMIEELVTPQDAPRLLETALSVISRDRVYFIQASSQHEGEHLAIWIKAAANQPFLKRGPQQPYHDPLTQIAIAFFERHRFNVGQTVSYRFSGAIVGPRLSGKSTLLGNSFDQFLLELAISGRWKSVFVFAIDIKQLAPLFTEYIELYHCIVDHLLSACARQRQTVRPHLRNLKRQLHSVTESRPPLSGVHPFHGVQRIARELNAAWRDPDGLESFIAAVFALPVTLPRAFGFTSAALFVDNLEYADVPIAPRDPFDPAQPFCFGAEQLKLALGQANFIVSCESVTALYQVLAPIDEFSLDLRSGLDVVTLYGATQDLGSRVGYDYLVELQAERIPVRMSVALCAGIPPYLAAWDELNHTLFQLERARKGDDRAGELSDEAIADAQRLVDLLFVSPDEGRVVVTGVVRERKSKTGGRVEVRENVDEPFES